MKKDGLFNLGGMVMKHIHGLVHVPQFHFLAGGQIDRIEPASPNTEFGLGCTQSVGGRCGIAGSTR